MGNSQQNSRRAVEPAREFLSFRLGGDEYGIDNLMVQEIRGYDAVTRIPNAPAFIKGVINLRGTNVPIVDMRIKFNAGEATYNQFTVVIVLNVGNRVVGMVVDSVSGVTALTPEQIRPAPEFHSAMAADHLMGLGTPEGRTLILLDIEKLMMSEGISLRLPDSSAICWPWRAAVAPTCTGRWWT